jgi:hypothetical protein
MSVFDAIVGSALFLIVLIVLVIAIGVGNKININFQNSDQLSDLAKNISAEKTNNLSTWSNWIFSALFIGVFIGTIVSALLVRTASPVFLVLSILMILISGVAVGSVKVVYDDLFDPASGGLHDENFFATWYQEIYLARWYFDNIFTVTFGWTFILLFVTYINKKPDLLG